VASATLTRDDLDRRFEDHRGELRGYCYRMLASPFEAEDAVQETFIRAWRSVDQFEGRASVRAWLYRIATNICLDMLRSRQRRARPMDLGPAREPIMDNLRELPEITWLEPVPDALLGAGGTGVMSDPADVVATKDSVRLAFVAALQHLPPKQRAALILCDVLQWKAVEAAELIETSVASINSALQRARATLGANQLTPRSPALPLEPAAEDLLARYVKAFEAYDVDALTAVIHEDAVQSMPPYDLWLSGRDDIFQWWWGPGIGCKGSRVVPVGSANGCPAFAQYKPGPDGYAPWALQVIGLRDGRIGELTFFLDTERLFPLWGLPLRLPA